MGAVLRGRPLLFGRMGDTLNTVDCPDGRQYQREQDDSMAQQPQRANRPRQQPQRADKPRYTIQQGANGQTFRLDTFTGYTWVLLKVTDNLTGAEGYTWNLMAEMEDLMKQGGAE